jgi:hypothetical protein
MFSRRVLLPFSGFTHKIKPSKKPSRRRCQTALLLLSLLFDPDDGDSVFSEMLVDRTRLHGVPEDSTAVQISYIICKH